MRDRILRRTFLGGVGATAAGALFVACGQPAPMESAEAPKADEAPKAEDSEPAPAEAVELEVWTTARWDLSTGLGLEVKQEIEAMVEGLTVKDLMPEGNRFTILIAAQAAGTSPDIGQVGVWQNQQVAAGGIVDSLEQYYAQSTVINKDDIWPSLRIDMDHKGQVWSMPFGPDVRFFYIHDNLYLDAGVDPESPPETWNQIEDIITKSFKSGGSGTIQQVAWGPLWANRHVWMVPMWQLGGENINEERTKITLNTEEGREGMAWLKKVHDMQGGYDALQEFKGDENARAHFYASRLANLYDTGSIRFESIAKEAPDLEYHWGHWPKPADGFNRTYGGCHTWVSPVGSTQKDLGWTFMEHFGVEDVNIRWAKHFDRLPIRVDTSYDERYHEGDPFVIHQVDVMEGRRFVVSAPGANEMLGIMSGGVPDILTGKITIEEGLRLTEAQAQTVLDEWLARE